MPGALIDGKAMAKAMRAAMKLRCDALIEQGVQPCLAVVLVGDDPASHIYVRNKEKACQQVGIESRTIRLPADVGQAALSAQVRALNADPAVDGILVQLPLPTGFDYDERATLALISPKKDVDGIHAVNIGALATGGQGAVSCTPKGAMALIQSTGIDLSGKEAVVVGRSNTVGKPMALLLLAANATVTVCHSRTANLAEHCRRADVLVAAIGRAKMITADMVKPGAIVIDVGINRIAEKKVVGDVDFESVKEVAGYITPVPGGVGPMTITMLMENTLESAEARR
ncbi:MAG: bifunctional methylenetetrahydrofolate dehydrogenase/methenyltetrahydrofolate cyclohydrolase FolD [Oscillospiraceae bacterium]|nr:bifunctional methylenetetrahydrofolate dehydrogenase/methenyltetrahydrofolate cyclohydrolase FolD [Oscillospiraceae bacterium]